MDADAALVPRIELGHLQQEPVDPAHQTRKLRVRNCQAGVDEQV
jgi:hypothetical protein